MFKLESYITPILLSYVNRYISNLKPEDSQVSLWGGDATFHNLELNLHVLEQELQLPFSFVSGSIRELSIHVPWTKLTSEPITITINTIECILNLKRKNRPEPPQSQTKQKKPSSKEVEAPQGYVQHLINKIVGNIRIFCNNLILKYVEEDIVLSMNIKHLKFQSANKKWEPAYADISTTEVLLRKLITVTDLTLCLDKRNASGKIEVYQEPMLYRCSLTMHLLKHYHSSTAKMASTTRLDIHCNEMEFSMTEQQVPMLLRLLMLMHALQQKKLKPEKESPLSAKQAGFSEAKDEVEGKATWSGWAWSYVSSVLPAPWDEDESLEQLQSPKGHTLHFGCYVDRASVTFKISESVGDKGTVYLHKKIRYTPVLMLKLQGIYAETIMYGLRWLNAMGGIGQAVLIPIGTCTCAYAEVLDSQSPMNYLNIGKTTKLHKQQSLFDVNAEENKGNRRHYNISWDHHMTVYSEAVLLERTPAVAFDYLYQIELPSDASSDILSEFGSDFEYSNLMEASSMRVCFGPLKLRLCSGLFHRFATLQVAVSYYDYPQYYTTKPDPPLNRLPPPSDEDFEALNDFIASRNTRITFFAPVIELELMDHPYFEPTKGYLVKRGKKVATTPAAAKEKTDFPRLTLECQFLDVTMNYPMYVNRLIHTTCQLPNAPKKLFDACFTRKTVKVVGLNSRLLIRNKQTTVLMPSSLSYSCNAILKPQYWLNPNIPHNEITFESESITLNATNAKMMVIVKMITTLINLDPGEVIDTMHNTSILNDACKESGFPYMELDVEGIRFKKVVTNATTSIDVSLGSIKAFIFEQINVQSKQQLLEQQKSKKSLRSNDIQQVLFLSGPEPDNTDSPTSKSKGRSKTVPEVMPLLTVTLQFPLSPEVQKHAPILIFNLQEINICVDPLLCKWLLYSPKSLSKQDSFELQVTRKRTESSLSVLTSSSRISKQSVHSSSIEATKSSKGHDVQALKKKSSEPSASAMSSSRKISSQSVHSSSSREPAIQLTATASTIKEEPMDVQERIYNILQKWFDVWKGVFLCGDVSQCTIYFPLVSLSAVGQQGIQQAVESAIKKQKPPEIMVITLPFANVRSSHRQSIKNFLKALPVCLPEHIWSVKKSSLPWTMSVSYLSCYTIQYGNKLTFLEPLSLNSTIGLSTKPTKVEKESKVKPNLKSDIGYLGICVHVDMTPILISTSEVQVYVFASILYGLMEVATNLLPKKTRSSSKKKQIVPQHVVIKSSPSVSPTRKASSLDSASGKTRILAKTSENSDTDSIRLTAWVQWTITRCTIELLSNECHGTTSHKDQDLESQPRLKLVVDAEDIVSSLDLQSVYLKIKSKIGSASIQHFKRSTPTAKWNPGPFSGTVMRLREDIVSSQRHEDNAFISVTITRASCQHTHTLWGAAQNKKKSGKKEPVNTQLLPPSRYITEIVANVQPIDFVISLSTLRSFYLVIAPLLEIPHRGKPDSLPTSSSSDMLLQTVNNQALPLAYLECQDIRVVMPSIELGGTGTVHDVVIFQVQKISLTPTAVNPICRSPIRQDIYDQAAHARILNVPGSDVEDRQYQFDVIGMSVSTGTWEGIEPIFSSSGSATAPMHSVSENPALEWNNLDQGHPYFTPILNLWNITEKFDISVVAAPAMLYKSSVIVCGHSVEINFVSDILVNLSLNQIRLMSAILSEFDTLVEPLLVEEGNVSRPKIKHPYSKFKGSYHDMDSSSNVRDSGIETSDVRSVKSSKVLRSYTESDQQLQLKKRSSVLFTASIAPMDVLITAGKIGLSLYQIDDLKPNVYKYKKKNRIMKFDSDDLGYEAEEDSTEEKELAKYKPLLYVCVKQPNVYLSKHHLGKRIQISCFDLNLKLCGPEYVPVDNVPTEDDYPIALLETKSGSPNPSTGILPAFFTLKYVKAVGKPGHLDIELSKPTKILCSMTRWGYLLTVRDRLLETFKRIERNVIARSVSMDGLDMSSISSTYSKHTKRVDTNSKFQEIKDVLKGTNSVNVRFDQIVLEFQAESGQEVDLGFERLTGSLTLSNRPEKMTILCGLHNITVTVVNAGFKKLLLNPWTMTLSVSLFWESWQSPDSSPQVQITAESDCIMIDISPSLIYSVQLVVKDISEFLMSFPAKTISSENVSFDPNVNKGTEKDQHYKDDLRAGAFQFIDASSEKSDELPLPYQVMFWSKGISAMAWRYPQPRALTKVRVFPVPYRTNSDVDDDHMVLCRLEYWSECRNCYLPYTQFHLSETDVCHLNLPENSPRPVVASTWRVVITADDTNETNSTLISPRALAACMRIDSYFDKALIPNLTVALYITKIDLSFYNYFDKNVPTVLPECLRNYTPDSLFPDIQRFLTLTFDNVTGYIMCWDGEMLTAEVSAASKCNVLDYMYLTEQSFIESFTFKLDVSLDDGLDCNFISKPIHMKLGPDIAHTIAVSSQMWSQSFKNDGVRDFIVMTRYVICNDSNVNIRFGQSGTDEAIFLPPRNYHLYSWRSQRKAEQLKVALDDKGWTRSFRIFEDGIQTIPFHSEINVILLVTVKSLSATQKQVIFSGQLIVSNMLTEYFDMKVVGDVSKENKESEFKSTPTYVVPGKSNTSSMFINSGKNYFLRLRFYGLEAAWTGDIPLREHATGSQPWLVKVPLQERGQFLSVWCRITMQEVHRVKRILAVLWPLFSVKSNLPISSQVQIDTPTLHVNLDAVVNGKGQLQQLYCPGTIDHSHQLTFKIDNSDPSATPYVPLNYSLVDHQKFFRKPESVNIDEILEELGQLGKSEWPYFGDELDDVEWIVGEQPLTHVQVRYQNVCTYSCSLLVELLPWCLAANTLGVPISVNVNGLELCRIPHYGIVAPPKLEENFTIGACSGGSWCYTEPLQLSKSDWSQSFYMPKFTGTIPLEGSIRLPIKCDSHICMLLVTSAIHNEIRLLKVSSTHILSNHMPVQVQVICFAIAEDEGKFSLPVNMERYSFTMAPHLQKSNAGISIIQWHTLSPTKDSQLSYALYMSFSVDTNSGWSCPIRVDKPLMRKSFSLPMKDHSIPGVLTSQEHKHQIFLSIHEDDRPQLFIENTTGTMLFVGQALGDGRVASECQHFNWHCKVDNMAYVYYTMPVLSEKFPEMPQDNFAEKLAIAGDPESELMDYHWSNCVSMIHDDEQFLRVPYYGDIRVKVVNTACSAIVLLESVSQVEISARDIRVRLLMQEIEKPSDVTEKTSEPSTKRISKLYTAEDLSRSQSDTSVVDSNKPPVSIQAMPPLIEKVSSHNYKRGWSVSDLSRQSRSTKSMMDRTLPMKEKWGSIKFNGFVQSFIVTFISDMDYENSVRWELASFVCDNIVCRAVQIESMKMKITASDVQFDNQMYSKESYDFPVVLVGQDKKEQKRVTSLNIPIETLIENCDENALVTFEICVETWCDKLRSKRVTGVRSVQIIVNPLSCYVEDVYVTKLMEYFKMFTPNALVILPNRKPAQKINVPSGYVTVPEIAPLQCAILAKPLTMRRLSIAPVSLLLSVHSSIKMYIALDQSPLQFGKFERRRIFTTPYRLGHALTMHYLSGAIFGAGWVVSSLELLGSPGGLARAMGTGLRDFVSLPCRGIFFGPMAFIRGVSQGSASLMRHVTAGTLQSVTKLASSVARNLDRLTLDEEHLKRTEEQRRQKPQGLAQGFIQGLTGLGISLLGAVGGIAHHPLQSIVSDGASPRSLAAGVGLGLVGIVTKPLSGAAELVALTGQGLLQGAGWNPLPEPRLLPQVYRIEYSSNSSLKYNWKHIDTTAGQMLYVIEATSIVNGTINDAVALILTPDALVIINLDKDEAFRIISLKELSVGHTNDPTVLSFRLTKPPAPPKMDDDCIVEMDPVSRARVADYVKNTVGLLNLSDAVPTFENAELDTSPISSPGIVHDPTEEATILTYYVSPQCRNYFIGLIRLAKMQLQNYNFPVL